MIHVTCMLRSDNELLVSEMKQKLGAALGLYLFKRLFLLGLFLGELIFGGACYRKEF